MEDEEAVRDLSTAFIEHRKTCEKCAGCDVMDIGKTACAKGLVLHRSGFELGEGMYVLQSDVPNPKPDRRSKDWFQATVFKAGERFFLEEDVEFKGLFSIRRLRLYGSIRARTPLFSTMVLALRAVKTKTLETLEIHRVDGRRVLGMLIDEEILTIETVLDAKRRDDAVEDGT